MGACECENPMDFDLDSVGKGTQTPKKYTINIIKEKKENNKINPNIKNLETKIESHDQIDIFQNFKKRIKNEEKIELEKLKYSFEERSIEINLPDNINISNDIAQISFNVTPEEPDDKFSKYIFDNINSIREDPSSFIYRLQKAKSNIIHDKAGKYIYKGPVKVALCKGVEAFDDAINYLKDLKPMQKLIFSKELIIESPKDEEEILSKKFMAEQINEKIMEGIPIKSFWKDKIKDPETCLLLMIVDDTGANSGKKRNDILDPAKQLIGISSKAIGKHFASYITLC